MYEWWYIYMYMHVCECVGVNLYTCERMDMGIYVCMYMYKCLGKRMKVERVWKREVRLEGNVTVREVMYNT